MKTYNFALYALLLFGLISFSEGKPCPERSRPHKTRCNAYYKCTVINEKKYVWLPAECEEGLIYEHSLGVCVLPSDDWECGQKGAVTKKPNIPAVRKKSHNKDADVYIISNAEGEDDEENMINSKYDDTKVDIVIGTGISDEIDDESGSEEINESQYDGSGNGAELVELDGFMQAPENRETEDIVPLKTSDKIQPLMETKEDLQEVLHTIKTKAEIGQPSSNIDPQLTAHLQRLSQLVDGLKQSYQNQDGKKPQQNLGPDQLNAFLAHFKIKNKLDTQDKNELKQESSMNLNKTSEHTNNTPSRLNAETKVVLNNNLPKRYMNQITSEGSPDSGGYSNSQIVINRPGGAVLFSLPPENQNHYEHHSDYSSADNTPKISEETLKTVLELSKQMIASQNIPKIIPNPAYFGSAFMQPVYLSPHMESPFSSDYYRDPAQSVFSSDFQTHNFRQRKPGKRPQQGKNPTTIIHNNVIPVHVSSPASGDKDVLDSYGQNVNLYPPLNGQEERPEISTAYSGGSYKSNKYSTQTTPRPSIVVATDSPLYGKSPKPYDFQPTSSTFNKYFTPTEHLNEDNVNQIFQTTDNFGTLPQSLKSRRPSSPSSSTLSSSNYQQQSMYSQGQSSQMYGNQNSQTMYPDNQDNQQSSQYSANSEDDTETISYIYGQTKPFNVNPQMQYPGTLSQSVFSSDTNPYLNRPNTGSQTTSISSSYGSSGGKNKYSSLSSPISSTSTFNEGAQLVNVGGNFISFDVFRKTILPLMGGNSQSMSSSALSNVEVITCAAGVRQPNTTDCTRYYVCSKKDGKVLSYSCPPYTAFNADSRICDARTYALCNPETALLSTYSIKENKRIQMETLKALQEVKRKQAVQQQQQQQYEQQQQALQAQQMANILQQYSPSTSLSNSITSSSSSSSGDSSDQNILQSYMQQAAAMASLAQTTTTRRPITAGTSKKRKYYCKEGDKIADQTSITSYFVCYKNAQGQMKGHKMTCSKALIFCPKTSMCTLSSKCS